MVRTPFQNVTDGSEWSPPFASEWNAIIDSAIANKLRHTRTRQDIYPGLAQQTLTVLASNDSGVDMSGFDVAVLKTPMWTAAENLDFFQYQGALSATAPVTTDRGRLFGIATEETPKGFTAPFQVVGLARVQVNILHVKHRYADIDPASKSRLRSGFAGSAKLVWQEPGTGVKWAVVQLGLLDEHEIKAVTKIQIEPNGSGPAFVWQEGLDTGAEAIVHLNWMHNDEPIPKDCQILARWFVDERKWVIVGAECKEAGAPTECQVAFPQLFPGMHELVIAGQTPPGSDVTGQIRGTIFQGSVGRTNYEGFGITEPTPGNGIHGGNELILNGQFDVYGGSLQAIDNIIDFSRDFTISFWLRSQLSFVDFILRIENDNEFPPASTGFPGELLHLLVTGSGDSTSFSLHTSGICGEQEIGFTKTGASPTAKSLFIMRWDASDRLAKIQLRNPGTTASEDTGTFPPWKNTSVNRFEIVGTQTILDQLVVWARYLEDFELEPLWNFGNGTTNLPPA